MFDFSFVNIGGASAFGAAMLWGLVSALLSPCHLGVIPILGSHAAGISPLHAKAEHEVPRHQAPTQALIQVLLFVLGAYLTIPLLGLLAGFVGQELIASGHYWTIPVGLLLVWIGWDMQRSHSCSHVGAIMARFQGWLGIGGKTGVLFLGVGYGVVAAGCTLGFLVPMLMVMDQPSLWQSLVLAAAFGLGHCLPMVVVGCSASLAALLLRKHSHEGPADGHSHQDPHRGEMWFRRILGVLIMLIGIYFIIHPWVE